MLNLYKSKETEIVNLISLSDVNKSENEYARNVLRFFAGIEITKKIIESRPINQINQSLSFQTTQIPKYNTYPNPSSNLLNIETPFNESNLIEIQVLDILGNVIKKLEVNSILTTINIS
ncbi:MAG: hypothetical protein RLZZ60_796, partial [Bacteroidota bacterium]